jgi:hypothetical protein
MLEPVGVLPAVLSVTRITCLTLELVAMRIVVPVTGETFRVESEIRAGQGPIAALEHPDLARLHEGRFVAFPAV